MTTKRPKISKREEEKAISRPNKPSKDDRALEFGEPEKEQPQRELSDGDLASSPWNSLAMFCNDSYRNFILWSEKDKKNQELVVQVQKKCVILLIKAQSSTWDEIIEQFEHREREVAGNFFFYLSRKHRDSPVEVQRQLKINLTQFVELAEYAFTDSGNRDLVKLALIADVISNYQNQERTFLFLSELPSVLDEESRSILQSSNGYQTILHWGASRFLKKFWPLLQQKFRITSDVIRDEATQNVLQECGETEANLRSQIELFKIENDELKNQIKDISSQSQQSAVYKFAKTLQEQSNPILDQIVLLYQRLEQSENEGLPLSSTDSLSVLIALEGLLEAFKSLNINQFPADTSQSFELRGDQLGEYSYVEGSAFADSEDKKMVRCIRPGWRVKSELITPARVKEITEES